MKTIIKTNNLVKKFKEEVAINNLNLTINEGDIYGLVGENGAGKSTLIRLITNIIKPTSGSVSIQLENRLGIIQGIIENPAIHETLSALDNLKFQNDLLHKKKTEKELLELLKLVDLENTKKRSKDYSLGMKQRLSIAMALVSDPKFILLDEPMNGLDPLGIKRIRDLIIELNQEKEITFLISSHLLQELDRVATKYGILSKGVLLAEITHDEITKSGKNIEDIYLDIVGGNHV